MIRRVLIALAALAVVAAGGYAYLQHTQPGWWVRLQHPLDYRQEVVGYARIYPLDPALVAAVIYEESRFRPDTVSSAGAVGLMQLLPSTARGIAEHTGGHHFRIPQDLYVPDLNIRYGCWYLAHLEQRYRGRPQSVDLALAAYNAGEAAVKRFDGVPPYPETQKYVADILRLIGR